MRLVVSRGWRLGLVLAFGAFVLTACGAEPMTEGSENPPSAPVVPVTHSKLGAELTQGGFSRKITASGFNVGASLGAKTSVVNGTTSGGYKVYFNVQGQTRQ